MDKRDRFEEIFRERLYNFEYNPDENTRKKIFALLPHRLHSARWIYRTVAAIAVWMLLAGSWLWIQNIKNTENEIQTTHTAVFNRQNLQNKEKSAKDSFHGLYKKKVNNFVTPIRFDTLSVINRKSDLRPEPLKLYPKIQSHLNSIQPKLSLQCCSLSPLYKPRIRKWRIGVGGGNLGLAALSTGSSGINDFYSDNYNRPTPPLDDPEPSLSGGAQTVPFTRLNTLTRYTPQEATNVRHRQPLSFGISLSRRLSERWNFQTGVIYTYLYSKWKYKYKPGTAQRQHLHLIGIPISVSYRLTHWQRPYCYCNTGILAEINVAGKLRNTQGTYSVRIPGILWSMGTKIGLSYPLIRFISAYAEGGICYYSDYKGDIETLRSKHHFQLTGQIGIRFNF